MSIHAFVEFFPVYNCISRRKHLTVAKFIIIITIIIGKAALFQPMSSLEDSARFLYCWRIRPSRFQFGFRNDNFLQSKVVNLTSNSQPGGPGLCIYVS
jgi:hypothetical protein